ncbi:MAG TPA: inositol monophosphatase family protein [Candidatus Acidoferrales bacterium]|nr:inositol monophosphatase family protein [Candidatus Acidoferrales bacterium]
MSKEGTSAREFLEVAVEAAQRGGAIIAEAMDRPKNVTYKTEVDLVTETDKKSEAAIVEWLRKHFPQHAIIAEEGGISGPDISARYKWYVDPLDGTTNFAHGYPVFAVSIGLFEEGQPLVAAICNPVTRDIFTAMRGGGAHRNERKIHVSNVDKLAKSLVATGFPTHKRVQNPNIDYYWEFTLRSHGVRRAGAAALDLCSVACGHFDGFWEFGLKPWDTAAGILLVQEAGGVVSDFSGRPYTPGGREILASNGLVHEEMRELACKIAAKKSDEGTFVPG